MAHILKYKLIKPGGHSQHEAGDVLAIYPENHPIGGQERLLNGFAKITESLTKAEIATYTGRVYEDNDPGKTILKKSAYKVDYKTILSGDPNLTSTEDLTKKSPIVEGKFLKSSIKVKK